MCELSGTMLPVNRVFLYQEWLWDSPRERQVAAPGTKRPQEKPLIIEQEETSPAKYWAGDTIE